MKHKPKAKGVWIVEYHNGSRWRRSDDIPGNYRTEAAALKAMMRFDDVITRRVRRIRRVKP